MATVQNANFIQYGRRTGKSKSATRTKGSAGSHQEEEPVSVGMLLPNGTDLRQIKVLPREEWNRIQYSLHAKEREMEDMRQARAEREALHAESKEIVKNWSNTIAGQRLKKLQARKLREEKDEESRVKIDIEEAKFQAAKRKEAIQKAKTIQYFQTDRIKEFHGALLLTEVLQERDAQVELKKQKEAALTGKDYELRKHYRENYERGIREDQMKARARYVERKNNADFQQIQAKEHEKQRLKEVEEDKKEGEELRKLAQLHQWEEDKLEEIRRKEKMAIMQSHKEHQNNKAAIRALELQQDEEEDEEIRLFASAKRKMLKLRKEKEKQLFKEEQDHNDRMVAMLASQLKQKVDDEDGRIEKAQKQRDQKLQKEVEAKKSKLNADLASIAAHRIETLKLKDQKEKQDKKKALELLEMKLTADRVFAEKQAERRVMQKDINSKVQAFHVAQINERADNERQNREDDLRYDAELVKTLAVEEEQFHQYADKVINKAKEKEQNLYPLVKAAQAGAGGGRGPRFEGKGGVRPSYLTADGYGIQLPNCQRSTTDSVKSNFDVGEASKAKKRLGFVW